MKYTGAKAESHYDNSHVYLMDCMDALRQTPDTYFDLALVDPPYGIKADRSFVKKTPAIDPRNGRPIITKPKRVGNWDNERPPKEYFDQLQRISKNQIIWGGNYFADLLPARSCWIVWDKVNGGSDQADCELAYTSFNTAVRIVAYMWCIAQGKSIKEGRIAQGNNKLWEKKYHPTQKPVKLYEWIYNKYLPNGGKVIDTHLGSGSNRIAADKARNIEFYGFEIDSEYYEAQEKRFKIHKMQKTLF